MLRERWNAAKAFFFDVSSFYSILIRILPGDLDTITNLYNMASRQYLSPSLRWTGLRAERNFLASGEGENAEPTPGTWSFFDELEME